MTPEEKQLLLKDLCARLPYGVKANIPLVNGDERTYTVSFDDMKDFAEGNIIIKPCLRPMSSMTESEEFDYTYKKLNHTEWEAQDYLNSHHFDYRGLIEKGLALKAPEGMYE